MSADGEMWFKAKQIGGLEFAAFSPTRKKNTQSTTPSHWYIQTKNGIVGPVSAGKLARLATKRKLQPNVAVSHDQIHWIKAKRVPGVVFESTSTIEESVSVPSAQQPSPRIDVQLPVINELPFVGPLPQLSELPLRRSDVVRIRLPVIQEIPIAGPLPQLTDLPLRRADVIAIALPVIQELPIAGPLPTFEQYAPKRRDPVSLPVIAELPVVGPLPLLTDLPLRRADIIKIALPVIPDLPIAGNVPTLTDITPIEPVAAPVTIDLGRLRRAAYIKQLGPIWQVDGSQSTGESAVDICIQPGSHERPFATLITSGMSNVPMEVPQGRWSPRCELILYAREPSPAWISLLRSLANIPISGQRGFYYGSTMSNGEPSRPIFANSQLDSFVFMVPAIRSDFQISQQVTIDNAPLQLLWVVPITNAEQDFLHNNGMKSFVDLLNQNQHLPVIDPQRKCYIENTAQSVG
ncbi:MAG: suppressor of fused domain protein [Pirellulaceae bacterium]